MLHLLIDTLRNSILITGLVTVMMMLIETLKIESRGRFFSALGKSKTGQVALASFLGLIPGCIGGFAAVSLYTGRIISFGALLAMMVVSCGDEAFMLIAMSPEKSLLIFAGLWVLAFAAGISTDFIFRKLKIKDFRDCKCGRQDRITGLGEHNHNGHVHPAGHMLLKRVVMFVCVAVFITALACGVLDHEHTDISAYSSDPFDFLSEKWMQYLFAGLSIMVLVFIIFASDRFVNENLWHHIVRKHLPVIFFWTFGILLLVELGLKYWDISRWISDNTALMILLAAAVGLVPESGPHLILVSLYAGGIVPLPVLLASCISQDGHSSLPLLAEDKMSFAAAKLINFLIALLVGYGCFLL